jgi:rhodanese-related sulfurtransferase
MDTTPRIGPEEARERIQSGQALLVCAYEDDEKFNALHLENAKSLREFHQMETSVPKDKELIFYCA